MMRGKLRNIIAVCLAVILLITGLSVCSKIMVSKKISNISTTELWDSLYNEPEGAIDVIFVGPSTIYYGLTPTEMYNDYGFTSYCISSPEQIMLFSELYTREVFRYQSPKVVVLDQTMFFEEDFVNSEGNYRTTMDHLRLSMDKLRTAWHIVKNDSSQSFLSYIFPLLRYHNRWNGLTREDFFYFKTDHYPTKGYSSSARHSNFSVGMPVFMQPSDEVDMEFDAEAVKHLENIKEVCEDNGAELLVIKMPVFTNYDYARHNGVDKLCAQMGIEYLDFNMKEAWETMDLNTVTDFVSEAHLNISGAYKATAFLGEYLHNTYELPDHRGDAAFSSWDDDVAATRKITLYWLQDAVYGHPGESLAGSKLQRNGETELYWPRLCSDINVNLYLEDRTTGERTLLLENSAETRYLFTDSQSLSEENNYFSLDYLIGDGETYTVVFPVCMNRYDGSIA